GDDVLCRVSDATDAVLVDGAVLAASSRAEMIPSRRDVGDPLPISSGCFACGVDNSLGLHARLFFDEGAVWTRWRPRDAMAGVDGSLAPVAMTALLDEAAFWLGALASGESGMTTELAVSLHEPVPFGIDIDVSGARRAARQRPDDGRFWDTEVI